jgi:hypothetical protein
MATQATAVKGSGGDDEAIFFDYISVVDGVQGSIDPDLGGTLIYTDSRGNQTIIEVPAGAVSDTTKLVYAVSQEPVESDGLAFAGHAFDLKAYYNDDHQPSFVFNSPVTITIHYSDADVGDIDELLLTLKFRDGSNWEDAACGSYDRHSDENWLAVPICHLSTFALFGEKALEKHFNYMPLVLRSYQGGTHIKSSDDVNALGAQYRGGLTQRASMATMIAMLPIVSFVGINWLLRKI